MRIAVMITGLAMSVMAQQKPVVLPLGQTNLGDIGRYRVAYQSYGGDVVEMPVSWSGHFEEKSGISYQTAQRLLGRNAFLLHSPWRVDPGKVWVDYRLTLPDTKPLKLAFGIAMKPGMVGPDKSDGVTFSCFLDAGAGFVELMRQHQTEGKWRDYKFDLAPFAGRTVTLRLQTEPGPKNSPSFDYSYFGGARIEAGATTESVRNTVARLVDRPAYKAVADKSLVALANDPTRGIIPASLVAGRNEVRQAGDAWLFTYEGEDCRIEYRYEPKTGTLDDVTVRVDGGDPFRPAAGGGVRFAGDAALQRQSVAQADDKVVATFAGPGCQVTWTFGIRDKAFLVGVTCDQPVALGADLGGIADADLRRSMAVPYFYGAMDYLPGMGLYACREWDWTQSNASVCAQRSASYHPKTDGTRNPLVESGYIAVSPAVQEVLPNLPHPQSPYKGLLGGRIMLDVWRHHRNNSYAGDAAILRDLKDNGVDHLAIIQHVWQRYGYDAKLPDHIPANPAFGGDEGMIEYGKAANECGYVWSVHENYIDLYPDAPSYDASARVLKADGSPSKAWFNKSTGVQSYGLKCNRALGYAKQNAPEIHRRYQTTAAYLDVHTCVPPWHQLDHEANQPFAAMARGKVKFDTELFQYMRDTHEGPLFGEGANHMYWAGRCDGVEAQVQGKEDHSPFLDFDLLRIHPQMVNHGMGYYERWFRRGYNHVPGVDSCAPFQIDKYRAQELAYGHAGFIGNLATNNIQWIAKEHNLMHPVQRLYGTTRASRIEYEVAGQFVTASVALAVDRPERQRITYDSGLRLWVNWGETPWQVEGRTLPQWGFLALGPDTEVWTAQTEQGLADYASCPEFAFVDARTHFDMPYLKSGTDIEPKIRSFKWLGDRKAEITYEWRVGEEVKDDYMCFVHFLNEGASNAMIAGQADHALPKPTSTWRAGEAIVDGPHVVEFPANYNDFEIVIGLYSRKGRLQMKGTDHDGHRYLIGVVNIADGKGQLGDLAAASAKYDEEIAKADFSRNMTQPGTWIDFGALATDGSLKVNRGKDRLVVYAYPRGRRFTVELDAKALGLTQAPNKIQALKPLSDEVLQDIPFERHGTRIRFTVGQKDAGRYLVLP
jgi:hypothetical protein